MPSRRVLIESGVERRDEFGFLDLGHTPRTLTLTGLAEFPATWITSPPWLGKTTVARGLLNGVRALSNQFGEIGNRMALAELGVPGIERDIPPCWWDEWSSAPEAQPAVWIIDGLDEGADQNDRLLTAVLKCLGRLSDSHRDRLRLMLFSRPHSGLTDFREQLRSLYPHYTERVLREFELARVDRATAEAIVGKPDFPRVLDTIRVARRQPFGGCQTPTVWRGEF